MTLSKKSYDLVTILIFFERSYVVTHSCKVSYSGLKWFRIYDGRRAHSPPPILFNVKKAKTGYIKFVIFACSYRHLAIRKLFRKLLKGLIIIYLIV